MHSGTYTNLYSGTHKHSHSGTHVGTHTLTQAHTGTVIVLIYNAPEVAALSEVGCSIIHDEIRFKGSETNSMYIELP